MSKSGDMKEVVKRILDENNVELKQAFVAGGLSNIAGHFLAKGLIERTIESKMRMTGVDQFNLAAELLDACETSLEHHPEENFPKFIAVLKKFGTMKRHAQKMEDEFKEAMMAAPTLMDSKHGEVVMQGAPSSGVSLDSEPKTKDLRMLVAGKVDKCEALGDVLELEPVHVRRIKKENSDCEEINMVILDTWMQQQTRKPTTWRTLLKALQEMNMKKLVDEITEELKQRPKSH